MKNTWKLYILSGCLMAAMLFNGFVFAADADVDPETLEIGEVKAIVHQSIGERKVLTTARARQGQKFSKENAEDDCGRIAKIDGVRKAYYNIEVVDNAVSLTYVAITDRFVGQILFDGNKKISDKKLQKELGLKTNDFLDISMVRTGVTDLTNYYLDKGYPFVKVELDEASISGTEPVVDVIYNIDEGPRCRVRKVTFEGNQGLKDRQLKKVPETRTVKYMVLPVHYIARKVPSDITSLRDAYEKFGYLNVKIDKKVEFSEDKKGAYVTFIIDEGPVFYVEGIEVTGNEIIPLEKLSENFRLVEGQAFGQDKADYDLNKITDAYKQIGYIDANIDFERRLTADNKVFVRFKLEPGPKTRIGRVYITGNKEVHGKVVRAILDEEGFTPGNYYDGSIASGNGDGELEKRVKDTILAKGVTIVPEELPESKEEKRADKDSAPKEPLPEVVRNAQVNVVESKTGSIMFGAGVNSNLGVVGNITLDQRNFDISDTPESWKEFLTGKAFKGAGQRFKISISPGTRQSSYLVSFGDSYVYDKPIAFETSLSSFQRYQEAYDETRTKAFLGFEKRYQNKWRRGVAFRVEQVDVDDIDYDAPSDIKDYDGKNNLFGARFYISKNTTDDIHIPSKGYNFNVGYEQLGGESTFGILDVTQRWYKTLYEDLAGRKTVLETKLHAGTIVGDAPFFERFYAGGTGSIRGFEYRGVSTRGEATNTTSNKEEDPIGSQWIMTASAEVVVPLEAKSLSWLFFADSGIIDQGGVRASIGTGVQILLPQWFGPVPMRFELAAPVMKDSRDETRFFSFSAGALF